MLTIENARVISPSIIKLEKLKLLDIQNCPALDIAVAFETLSACKSLKKVIFSLRGKELPLSWGKMQNVSGAVISVTDHGFDWKSMDLLNKTSNLRTLQIQSYGIDLPAFFNVISSSSVKRLDLSRNKLTGLPKEIGLLQNLDTLLLSDNRIAAISDGIGDLRKLKYLDLQSQRESKGIPDSNEHIDYLTQIPPSIARMTSLRTLLLYGNGSIPTDDLKKLQNKMPGCEIRFDGEIK